MQQKLKDIHSILTFLFDTIYLPAPIGLVEARPIKVVK
jgi:hypothetical protein